MKKTVIADTSCIILFEKIDELNLIRDLYNRIFITYEIATEYGMEIPNWINIKSPSEKTFQKIINMNLDKGEASAIALALDLENPLLIIDDLKGRKIVEKFGFNFIGSLGVIEEAKIKGIVSSIKPLMEKIKKTNFRISEKLEKKLYESTGENSG